MCLPPKSRVLSAGVLQDQNFFDVLFTFECLEHGFFTGKKKGAGDRDVFEEGADFQYFAEHRSAPLSHRAFVTPMEL
jgi:hypothetical protein